MESPESAGRNYEDHGRHSYGAVIQERVNSPHGWMILSIPTLSGFRNPEHWLRFAVLNSCTHGVLQLLPSDRSRPTRSQEKQVELEPVH